MLTGIRLTVFEYLLVLKMVYRYEESLGNTLKRNLINRLLDVIKCTDIPVANRGMNTSKRNSEKSFFSFPRQKSLLVKIVEGYIV